MAEGKETPHSSYTFVLPLDSVVRLLPPLDVLHAILSEPVRLIRSGARLYSIVLPSSGVEA